MNQICGYCKWHRFEKESEGWVCTNPNSENYSDWTDYGETCDEQEEH